MNDLTQAKRLIKECRDTQNPYLELGKCGITDLSELPELLECKHLESLNLSGNQIFDFSLLENLTGLQSLNLRYNEISDIHFLENLTELLSLNLRYDQISDISSLENLTGLQYLDLSGNQISDISFLSNLTSLQSLKLSGNQISDISFLSNLTGLQSLNLSYNRISEICLKDMTDLQSLYLEGNPIFHIRLENLTGLQSLNLSSHKFSEIHLENLTSLQSLDLSKNQISDIRFLSNLTGLQSLDLSNNQISDISILVNLTGLKSLYLGKNQISDISFLSNLTDLKSLDLRDNQIKELQPFIFQLNMEINMNEYFSSGSNGLWLYGNPIEKPPLEIVKQGKEAIQIYFNQLKSQGSVNIYEAKLLLVGDGGAGKTSLQKRLLDENALLPEEKERTRGIEIVDFKFEEEKVAHIWDFGGQDVYYPVHRFFITANTVFVLLASTRPHAHNFDYWIPTIFQFGGKSPVIIGQTCHDGNAKPWNDLGIYLGKPDEFNIIKTLDKPYYELDLPNKNRGLNVIKECIISQIENLPHFREKGGEVPQSWQTIRNRLLEKSKSTPCIPFDSFTDLCRETKPDDFEDIKAVEVCCQFLNDIGAILWYRDMNELRDWVVLKPEWAMNAVYKLIDDENIQKNNGHIRHEDFERIWSDKTYAGKHNILKKMLERFKIAFPTKDSRGEDYILPARLESMPSEKNRKLKENSLQLEYRFEFMPKGIVNQLSAELSRYIHGDEVWNDAVNLTCNESESQIFEEFYNRKLTITTKGIDARGVNMLIMNSLKDIIESYRGVKEEIYVKCTCKTCQQSEKPTIFPYDKLVEWSKKRDTVPCLDGNVDLNISELLYNVGFGKTGTQQSIKKISIFLASSEELKEDREKFEIFINRENKEYIEKGIFLKLEIWEDFIDCMSKTRLQDEYNKAAIHSDIFVSLFWTKTGKYTKEEFNEAYNHFKKNGKPSIYTYFKTTPPESLKDLKYYNSILEFQEELKGLGHYPTDYKDINDLKYQFKNQLEKNYRNTVLPNL